MAQKQIVVTMKQYRALQQPQRPQRPQRPIKPPSSTELLSSNDLFDFEAEKLVANKLATYKQVDKFRKKLPRSGLFVLVPPHLTDMSLNNLMALVIVDGKKGVTYIRSQYFEDLEDKVNVPSSPYFMIDIEDGDKRRNVKPSVNRHKILQEGRSPYTMYEGIVHAILFPETLKHHYLDLVGSRCRSGSRLCLCLVGGRPRLNIFWNDGARPRWGAPSCGSRVGA